MKGEIIYSYNGSKKRPALMATLRTAADKYAIKLSEYRDRIKSKQDVQWLLKGSDNGFADILKKTAPRSVLDMSYSQCVEGIVNDPRNTLISIMGVLVNDDGSIFRIERNMDGVKYFIRIMQGLCEKKEGDR